MLLSVFTPTHNPTYLDDVWRCLKQQTYERWEWVVVPNGELSNVIHDYVKQLTTNDPRVRIKPAPANVTGIGALKRFACDHCTGDVFVEYDHDDLITPDCLHTIADTLSKESPITFLYSDSVSVTFEGVSQAFLPEFGWKHYDWAHNGRTYRVNRAYNITPRSLCEILYAPDHVRAWTRGAYRVAGGHNTTLPVGDDHDLIVRTYLKGVRFVHICRPLYLHRMSAATTSGRQAQNITVTSQRTRDRYLHPLIEEWCSRNGLAMLDLGGAHNSPPGFRPIDRSLPSSDPYSGDVFDVLENKIPENSVGCFRAFDFLEHVAIGQVTRLMNLLYSRLVPGGFLMTHTPAVSDFEGKDGRGAYQEPDNKIFWPPNNFLYYTDAEYAKYQNGDVKCRFQTVRLYNYYPSDFHKQNFIPYVLWDGMALKDDDANYYPGPRRI